MGAEKKLNVVTALMVLTGILFSFFCYAMKDWREGVTSAVRDLQQLSPRVVILENTLSVMERRIDRIDSKLDFLVEREKSNPERR